MWNKQIILDSGTFVMALGKGGKVKTTDHRSEVVIIPMERDISVFGGVSLPDSMPHSFSLPHLHTVICLSLFFTKAFGRNADWWPEVDVIQKLCQHSKFICQQTPLFVRERSSSVLARVLQCQIFSWE